MRKYADMYSKICKKYHDALVFNFKKCLDMHVCARHIPNMYEYEAPHMHGIGTKMDC